MPRVKTPAGPWTDAPPLSLEAHGAGPVTVIRPKAPTARQQEVWDAVQRLGTQMAAARELHTSQGSIHSAVKLYMQVMGIDGPAPGLLTPAQVRERRASLPTKTVARPTRAATETQDRPVSVPEPEPLPPGLVRRLRSLELNVADHEQTIGVLTDVIPPVRDELAADLEAASEALPRVGRVIGRMEMALWAISVMAETTNPSTATTERIRRVAQRAMEPVP